MENYINQLLEEAPYDMAGIAKTPAACHLFNVNDGARKLDEKKAQLFHHMVAKLCIYVVGLGKTFKWLLLSYVLE